MVRISAGVRIYPAYKDRIVNCDRPIDNLSRFTIQYIYIYICARASARGGGGGPRPPIESKSVNIGYVCRHYFSGFGQTNFN